MRRIILAHYRLAHYSTAFCPVGLSHDAVRVARWLGSTCVGAPTLHTKAPVACANRTILRWRKSACMLLCTAARSISPFVSAFFCRWHCFMTQRQTLGGSLVFAMPTHPTHTHLIRDLPSILSHFQHYTTCTPFIFLPRRRGGDNDPLGRDEASPAGQGISSSCRRGRWAGSQRQQGCRLYMVLVAWHFLEASHGMLVLSRQCWSFRGDRCVDHFVKSCAFISALSSTSVDQSERFHESILFGNRGPRRPVVSKGVLDVLDIDPEKIYELIQQGRTTPSIHVRNLSFCGTEALN